ncbi:MAG: penicillin-binding protein 2, partial [Victivallales bacterium]|nr:penicillin-binding protein 2 [Victivallales bacterium]
LCGVPGVKVEQNFNAEEGQTVSYRAAFHPYALEESARRQSIQQLTQIFQLHERVLKNKCEQAHARGREIIVATKIPREDATQMMRELEEYWRGVEGNRPFLGVNVKESWKRIYPLDCELANLLGYVNDVEKEYQAVCGGQADSMPPQIATQKVTVAQGMSGIESMMDGFLCPTYGKYTYKHYRGGRPVEDGVSYQVQPQKGADVYLTIDETIQQILEEELAALCLKHDPDHAYVIMMEPSTGAIMAVAQYPQFNPNDRSTYAPESTRNHFIALSYEPGSIMKPVSLSAVLASRQANLDTKIDCEKGVWYYCGIPLHDSHSCGVLTLAGVIQQSSNIGTAKFAVNLGGEAMYRHLLQFGLGERSGIGFYPEGQAPTFFRREDRGRFAEYRHWDKLSITRFPIGQGLRVTPMQILQMWSALANHGVMMQPYIVDHVQYADGRVEYTTPQVKGRPISPEVAEQMTEALKLVTQKEGTGRRAAVPGYEVAGKTGTAQLWINADKEKGILGHYSSTEYFASFVGFVPADQPRFLLLVSIDNPKEGAHTGGAAAAPVFQKIAARTLEYLQVPGDAESAQKHTIGSVRR